MSERTQRRLAAIISADVVGYSRLVGADETGTLAALRAHRDELIDPLIAEHDGRIVKSMGDGLLLEFASVVDATQCAIAVQQGMAERNRDVDSDRRIIFRIGINLGDIVIDGEDILGDGVNIAARVEKLSEPGDVCISATAYDQIAGKLETNFVDLGEQALKNIERPIRIYSLSGKISDAADRQQRREELFHDTVAVKNLSHFDRPSIVVMPFKDLGGGDQDSLAEGLRLSLHSMLIKLSGLFLLHTGTVERYREQEVSAVEVGTDLGVRYVVEGAVQRVGNRVRVNLELTDCPARQLVWSERYDRVLDDIFELEDEIALEIVDALDITLRAGESGRAWWRGHSNPAMRQYVHRGISHFYKGSKDDNSAARRLFEKLDTMQPNWPQCLGLIAATHWRDAKFGWSADPAGSNEKAAVLAERSIELGDPDGIGHAILGQIRLFQRRHHEAIEACGEGLARRPSCPLANGLSAEVMQFCGDPGRAIVRMKEAIRHVQVFPPWMAYILAASFRDNGDLDDSIAAAKEFVRLFPDELDGWIILCSDYILSDSNYEAKKVAQQILRLDPSFSISSFAESQPYRDQTTLESFIEGFSRAGLPE